MFEAVDALVAEYSDLEATLADPAIHSDQNAARKLARRYAHLRPAVTTYREWQRVGEDLAAAQELSYDDPSFRGEADELAGCRAIELPAQAGQVFLRRPTDDDERSVRLAHLLNCLDLLERSGQALAAGPPRRCARRE